MKKLTIVFVLAGILSSCGNVLTLNKAYNPTENIEATETTDGPITATATENTETTPLGYLLSSLAGNNDTETNSNGTALTTEGVVSGLLSSILNSFNTVDKNSIVGTWHFKGSSFIFESENMLATFGSDLLASQVEAKVDNYLAKYNIKDGSCAITFNKDNTYEFFAGDYTINGTYELNNDSKELHMTFGMFATTANLVYDANTINLVYQSDGFLNLMKTISSAGNNSTFALLNGMLEQYNGLRIGMAFGK